MSSKPRFPISGMRRGFSATEVSTPVASDEVPATSLARRGIAISGAGRRLGISGMRRPFLESTPVTTPDDTNEGLK